MNRADSLPHGCRQKAADILLAAMIAGSVSAVGPVSAADNYPSKPIRIVCPFPPGGGADSVARILGDKLSERSGKPVIVDNRSGASGAIGAGIVAKAAPDGYTVLLGSSSILAASPALHGQTYQAIARNCLPHRSSAEFGRSNTSLDTPKTVADFIRYAGAQPDINMHRRALEPRPICHGIIQE